MTENIEKLPQTTALSSRKLLRQLMEAETPEKAVRSVPAQALFLAVRNEGLESAVEVIEAASLEQCRLFLDFDCWQKDRFCEESFWEWLALTDAAADLRILKKVAVSADQKLVALLVSRYVDVRQFDEPTEQPPGPEWHTPDKGYTWLFLQAVDERKNFLLGRLLAFSFESDPDWFYQLLAAANISSQIELEELAYSEKSKRLAAEGIPDAESAYQLNSPLPEQQVLALLKQSEQSPAVADIAAVAPLLYDSQAVQPLFSVLVELAGRRDVEAELTLIMNSAIVRWLDEFHDPDAVQRLAAKVKGALNIGLESALRLSGSSGAAVFEQLGAQTLYRLGLQKLQDLRLLADDIARLNIRAVEESSHSSSLIDGLRQPFPEMPAFLRSDGTLIADQDGVMPGGYKAIETSAELEAIRMIFQKLPRQP